MNARIRVRVTAVRAPHKIEEDRYSIRKVMKWYKKRCFIGDEQSFINHIQLLPYGEHPLAPLKEPFYLDEGQKLFKPFNTY